MQKIPFGIGGTLASATEMRPIITKHAPAQTLNFPLLLPISSSLRILLPFKEFFIKNIIYGCQEERKTPSAPRKKNEASGEGKITSAKTRAPQQKKHYFEQGEKK